MNIKFVAGFLAGIILVVLVWSFFPDIRERFLHDGQSVNNVSLSTLPEEKKEVVPETNLQNQGDSMEQEAVSAQKAVENKIDTADAMTGERGDEIDLKKSTHEQNHVSWAEVDRTLPEVDEVDRSLPEVAEADLAKKEEVPGNQIGTPLGEPKMLDQVVSGMDATSNILGEEGSGTVLTASDGEEKFFFWKPFFLESKAKNFAAHISSASNVNCLVDKTGTGNYQVYYLYKDEADKLAKAELIKNIGITF